MIKISKKSAALFSVLFLFAEIILGQPTEKKNILFIAVDDLKPNLGCFDNEQAISPNIDKLADAGITFFNNQCQQAVCGPSRASLLTGWRPDKTEIWDLHTFIRDRNPDVVTLPQYFKNNGYETAGTGKIFDPRSVDDSHDEQSWSIPYVNVTGNRWLISEGKPSTESADLPDEDYVDGKILDAANKLLLTVAEGDKPFFLAVGFKKPHLPFVAPQRYWDMYDRNDFQIHPFQQHAENSPDYVYTNFGELRGYDDIPDEGDISEEKQLELIHGYFACVSFIDAQIGKILAKLDSLGLTDNTIIVLWGDHGWHLGDHGQWAKHTNFEQATRAPLIIIDPDYPDKKIVATPTDFIDVYPTLCDLTGLQIPEGLAGVSLKPILNGEKNRVKDFALSQYKKDRKEGYTIRTDRYRYTEWLPEEYRYGDLPYDESIVADRELYDYQVDPLETKSFIYDDDYQNVVDSLHVFLADFLRNQFGDAGGNDSLGNLVRNPDFENGTNNWTARNCNLEEETDMVQNGNVSMKVTNRTAIWGGASQILTQGFSTWGEGKYIFSAYYRTVANSDTAKMQLRIKAGGETKYYQIKDATNGNGWTRLLDTLNVSWSETLEEAKLTLQTKNNQNISYYVDNVSIKKDTVITGIGNSFDDATLEKFKLFQNYPNPFSKGSGKNSFTIIKYQLPESYSRVTLRIYDMLGCEIYTLINERQTAGVYEIPFDAAGLSSGVYIYRLQTERFGFSKKMLIIK